jgi:hypothetical protein
MREERTSQKASFVEKWSITNLSFRSLREFQAVNTKKK